MIGGSSVCSGFVLCHAELPYDTKYPVFLSREKYLAVLIVRAAHERVFHGKTNQTLVELKQKFWITRGRAFVKTSVTFAGDWMPFPTNHCRQQTYQDFK